MESERYDNIVENVAKTIVHDFMNCFSYIRCYCELLQSSEMTEEELKEFAQNSILEIDKLSRMTNEIMEYIRCKDDFEFKQHPVSEIIDSVASSIKDGLEAKGVKLIVECGFDGKIASDADRLKQAILKIINNSFEAMPSGGGLILSARVSGDSVEINIKDSGPGIPEAVRDRVFEPFFVSGKKAHLGLGLTFAKRVIEAHKGEIAFESFVDGTLFTIKLPLRQ